MIPNSGRRTIEQDLALLERLATGPENQEGYGPVDYGLLRRVVSYVRQLQGEKADCEKEIHQLQTDVERLEAEVDSFADSLRRACGND